MYPFLSQPRQKRNALRIAFRHYGTRSTEQEGSVYEHGLHVLLPHLDSGRHSEHRSDARSTLAYPYPISRVLST